MLKKTITYENPFTEQAVTEVHYFHISKADLVEMEMEEHGTTYTKQDGEELTGMQAKLQRIVDSQDGKAIMTEIKDIIRRSYGKKEGDRFLKSQTIWEDFSASEAFSQLLWELCTNAGAAAEFMNGVVPSNLEQIAADIREQAEKAAQTNGDVSASEEPAMEPPSPERMQEVLSATSENPVTLTPRDIREMDANDLQAGLTSGRFLLQ